MNKFIYFLLLCLLLPAQAQDAALQAAISQKLSGRQTSNVKVSGNWATVQWAMTEAEGMAIFHRYGSNWELVQSGGGAIGEAELAVLGVPPEDRARLMPGLSQEERARVVEVLKEPQWTWLTQKKLLTDQDLEYYTAWELTLIRNEVFALHGRAFSNPELNALFRERPWYQVKADYRDSDLSKTERANVDFISAYQKRTGKL